MRISEPVMSLLSPMILYFLLRYNLPCRTLIVLLQILLEMLYNPTFMYIYIYSNSYVFGNILTFIGMIRATYPRTDYVKRSWSI